MDSYEVFNLSDFEGELKRIGIIWLTGEACNFSMRILCDITPNGKRVLSDYFGISITMGDSRNGRGAVGSMMLTRDIMHELVIFNWMLEGKTVAKMSNEFSYGGFSFYVFDNGKDAREWSQENRDKPWFKHERTYRGYAAHPHIGSRNIHAMTGTI